MTRIEDLLVARYGAFAPQVKAELNPTLETLLSHRSVRQFTDENVTDDELKLIIAAAQSASTSSSLQVCSVAIVNDKAKRERLAEVCGASGEFVRQAPVFMVWLIDFARAASILELQQIDTNTFDLIESTSLGFLDLGIASQNALLAAESLGLGGVYAGSLRNDVPSVIETLKLPKYVFPAFGLAIGHPDRAEKTSIKPRLPQAAVVHYDEYNPDAWADTVPGYDEEFAKYYAGQGVSNASWMRTLGKRLSNPEILHGRQQLRKHLEAQGFDSK